LWAVDLQDGSECALAIGEVLAAPERFFPDLRPAQE